MDLPWVYHTLNPSTMVYSSLSRNVRELVAPRELHHVALEDQETPGLDAGFFGQRATLGQS